MIDYQTAVLVGAALEMGAIVAEASSKNRQDIYDFGRYLGIAFQLQDDYLDAFGDTETFGNQVGGDILENKKTFLYLKEMKKGNSDEQKELTEWFSTTANNGEEKIKQVKLIIENTNPTEDIQTEIRKYP